MWERNGFVAGDAAVTRAPPRRPGERRLRDGGDDAAPGGGGRGGGGGSLYDLESRGGQRVGKKERE